MGDLVRRLWDDRLGMTVVTRRQCSSVRIAREEYALLPITALGRVRGRRPGPRRLTARWERSGLITGESPAWPGVRATTNGRPWPSTSWGPWSTSHRRSGLRRDRWLGAQIRVVRFSPLCSCGARGRLGASPQLSVVACWYAELMVKSTRRRRLRRFGPARPKRRLRRPDGHGPCPRCRQC